MLSEIVRAEEIKVGDRILLFEMGVVTAIERVPLISNPQARYVRLYTDYSAGSGATLSPDFLIARILPDPLEVREVPPLDPKRVYATWCKILGMKQWMYQDAEPYPPSGARKVTIHELGWFALGAFVVTLPLACFEIAKDLRGRRK